LGIDRDDTRFEQQVADRGNELHIKATQAFLAFKIDVQGC